MNKRFDKLSIIRLLSRSIVILMCIYSAYYVYNVYSKSELLKFENKNIEIKGARGSSRGASYYRSIYVMERERRGTSFANQASEVYLYKDSINSQRPLLFGRIRWAKFPPNIHKYVFLKHNDILNAEYLYFYHYKTGTKDGNMYALTANKKPSKIYLFLHILQETAVFLMLCILLFIFISELFVRKLKIDDNIVFDSIVYIWGIAFIMALFL